jgi:predicted SAM-dependent methyltransferase
LDIGCGNGNRLIKLHSYGFSRLSGIEPYLDHDEKLGHGINIYKSDIYNHKGKYDYIMFNHVFEHLCDPHKALNECHRLLRSNGKIQISMPVSDNYLYKTYKENWMGLDAPRHLHLFSKIAFIKFVEECGFRVYKYNHDSRWGNILTSIQYSKDISMYASNSYHVNKKNSIFNSSDIKKFKKLSKRLIKRKEGDTVSFFLEKRK